jgi:hypothetical protein
MGLDEWFDRQSDGALTRMLWRTRELGTPVSWSTICRAKRGLPVGHRAATIISRYTRGKVSYAELRAGCAAAEAAPPAAAVAKRQRKRRRAA